MILLKQNMDYKEYNIEDKKSVNLESLKAGFISKEDYAKAHQNTIIVCADIMIWYNGGFLLVKRDNVPALGEIWCLGGRMQRGIPLEENVKIKAMAECGLSLKNISLLNVSRSYWATDPFGHGKGTDTITFVYYAEGFGDLKLDNLHSNPLIIDYNQFIEIKNSLHPQMIDFLELAFKQR